MALKVEHTFDENTYRHYLNGFLSVLHCHHYLCLTSRMAEDFDDIGGRRILQETAEDTIRPLFDDYLEKNGITRIEERLMVCAEYYSVMGLGRMKLKAAELGGQVQLLRSHLDEGWINKWGKHDKHVNFFTCGFIAAIFAAGFKKPPRSYTVAENESIVTGSRTSLFMVNAV